MKSEHMGMLVDSTVFKQAFGPPFTKSFLRGQNLIFKAIYCFEVRFELALAR